MSAAPSRLIKMQTSKLSGLALDYMTGLAVKAKVEIRWEPFLNGPRVYSSHLRHFGPFIPSQNWTTTGPLIDKHGVSLKRIHASCWAAGDSGKDGPCDEQFGETLLIAACRTLVCRFLGEEVSVPGELITEPMYS